MAEIHLDDVAYPLVDAEDAWRVVSQSEVLTDTWDEWVEMGHPKRFRGGYYYAGGFDPTSGVLRLPPFYHADNNIHLSTGYGYGFEAPGPTGTIAHDASDDAKASSTTVTISNFTVAAGNNRILIVRVSTSKIVPTTSVTFGGVALTSLDSHRPGGSETEPTVAAYYLLNPSVSTADIVFTGSVSNDLVIGASSYTDINLLDPFGTIVKATGTSQTPSVVATSAAGELVIDVVSATNPSSCTVDGSQTQRWNDNVTASTRGAGSEEAGAAAVTMSWALGSSVEWTILAVTLNPSTSPFVYWGDGDKIFKYAYDSAEGLTEVVAESGTADGGSAAGTLVDAAPDGGAWSDDDFNDNLIEITGGTGVGQRRYITDTTDAGDVLAIAPNWDVTPDNTSTYVIYASVHVGSGAAGRPVYAISKWVVPMGAAVNARRLKTIGATVDAWEDAGFKALHMCTYQVGPLPGFARVYDTNKVDITYETTEVDADSWAGDDFPVGDTSTAITDTNEINGELIVNKEDVAYQFDLEGTSRPIGTFKNRAFTDPDNGRGTKVWLDRAFIPSNQGLDRYVIGERLMGVGINRIVGFRDVPSLTSPRARRHAYVEAVGHSIYCQLNSEEMTGLMHARHREAGDPVGGELVWNHVLEIPLSKGMYVDSQNNLWLKGASTSEADRDLRVIELDDNGGLQKALRRGQVSSTHEIWFDETDFRHPDESKQFASLMIETSNWATGASLQATIYRDDGSVGDVGDPITSATLTELTWSVGTNDTGRRGRLRLVLTTDATYDPLMSDPLILHVTAKARTPTVYEGIIDASPGALAGGKYDAAETLKVLRRLVAAGFKNIGEPDVEATFEGEVVAVREKMVQGKPEAYEIPVLIRRWVVT